MNNVDEQSEEWRPVLGWEEFYEVSSLGRVRSLLRAWGSDKPYGGKQVKPILGSRRYLVVNLTNRGKRQQIFVHKLVLEAFVGPRPEGAVSCHGLGGPLDNSTKNLRWDTQKANMEDKIEHGTRQFGERIGNAKLTDSAVTTIRREKLSVREVMTAFGISKTNARRVIDGVTWKHVA